MSYTPPTSSAVSFDFSVNAVYSPPKSGEMEFSWGSIFSSFIWQPDNRKYTTTLTWGAVGNAVSYEVALLEGAIEVANTTTDQLELAIPDCNFSSNFTVIVTATDGDGSAIEVEESTFTTPAPVPIPVTNIISTVDAEEASFSWDAVGQATWYTCVLYKNDAVVEKGSVSLPSINYTGLVNAANYKLTVAATNSVGSSETNEMVFKTLYVFPNPVTNVHQNGVYTLSVLAMWSLPTNTSVLQVEVEARKAGTVFFNRVYHGPRTEANISVLVEDTDVEVRVRANNPRGWSDWSTWASLKSEPLVQPDGVLGLLAAAQQSEVQDVRNWTGATTEERGIIEGIGMSASLMVGSYKEIINHAQSVQEEVTTGTNVTNFSVSARNVQITLDQSDVSDDFANHKSVTGLTHFEIDVRGAETVLDLESRATMTEYSNYTSSSSVSNVYIEAYEAVTIYDHQKGDHANHQSNTDLTSFSVEVTPV